jgi:sensor histidine kinase YesM
MIKIRTRLLIYFAVILCFLIVLFYVQSQSNKRVSVLYDESMDRFFLLNEMTSVTTETIEALHIYVLEPMPENLVSYEEHKVQLEKLQEQFAGKAGYEDDISKKNYQNIIASFIEHTDQSVEEVRRDNIQMYSYHLNEAEKISGYIHEMTQDLINHELTSYQNLYEIVKQKIYFTQRMGTSIFIAIILLSILFAFWFSHGITRTIAGLTRAAEEISAGRYAVEDVKVSTKDELYFLTSTFNQMKKNINQSVKDIEEKARLAQLLKEMELRSLQNQINPHFLFNTLNTISKTAYIEGAERTSDLISSVSALLRYNLGRIDKPTILGDEVEIVKEYFFIQKTRFGDRVEFVENIDPECLSVPLPCLTLQPIVENAFMHGIEEMAEGAKIELAIYQDHETVHIEVSDNGAGMEKETIQKMFNPAGETKYDSKKGAGHSHGIGMANVISRLQLFDKRTKITLESAPGQGTKVIIQLCKDGNEDSMIPARLQKGGSSDDQGLAGG